MTPIYGFTAWIASMVAYGICFVYEVCECNVAVFLAWAYLPQQVLHGYGITYYPDKYWAIAVPSMLIMSVLASTVFSYALNFTVNENPKLYHNVENENERDIDYYRRQYTSQTPDMIDIHPRLVTSVLVSHSFANEESLQ